MAAPTGLIPAMKSLRVTFDKYAGEQGDKDTLTKAEYGTLLSNEILKQLGDASCFKNLDENLDDVISYQEYLVLVLNHAVELQATTITKGLISAVVDFKATFDRYAGEDGNKDTLTTTELKTLVCTEFQIRHSDKGFEDLFKELDTNRDGDVTYLEFVKFVGDFSAYIIL